jgi:hypothetical protein
LVQEVGNQRRWSENRPHSAGNWPTQPINRLGRDGGSAAEEISGGGVKTGRIQLGIGRAHDGRSVAQEIGGGMVKTGHIRPA